MRDIKDLTVAFVDHQGLYYALARKLATFYKRVLYWDPSEDPFESVNEAMIGETFPEDERFERIDDLFLHKKECDFFIFPDSNIKSVGLQLELESQGYPVWGPRRATYLEQSRELFTQVLKDNGFQVPPYKRLVGVEKLRDYLKDKENQFIKVSRFRGTMETRRWRSWDEDEAWLDMMAVKLGGVKNLIPFLAFESIETDIELGADTYCVRGQMPSHMLDGFECKDKGYFASLKPVADLPPQTQAVMDTFAPILGKSGAITFWSVEIRVKDDDFYFNDATPRGPLPGIASQMEMYSNLGTIFAAGVEGELVQPESVAGFSAECVLTMDCKGAQWPSLRVPKEIEQWVKLSGVCQVNGRDWFPPLKENRDNEIGWLVAIGDSPQEVIETMLDHKAALPDGVEAHTDSLIDILKEIHQAQAEGIEWSHVKVPEPQIVIQANE